MAQRRVTPSIMRSRTQKRIANNLGVIAGDMSSANKVRDPRLEMLDSYYDNTAYDHLMDWDQPAGFEQHVPIRKRKPRIVFNFAKVLCSRVAAKLVGTKTFPQFSVEDDPDTTELIRLIIKKTRMKAKIVEPVRRMLGGGSVLVRFGFIEGQYKLEHYLGKFCYPTFDSAGGLQDVRVQYVFPDMDEMDEKGHPKLKWFRLDLGTNVEVLYDNPPFNPQQAEPVFTPVDRVEHNLGFVQAEWFRSSEANDTPDGFSLFEEALDFIDALNYSLSQSDQAVSYNQDPQMLIKGMDEEEIEALIRSALKAWNLGREGEASLLEANMAGVQTAEEARDRTMQKVQDLTRIVMLDPEKIIGSAQSGKAMEVLHGPFMDLINEIQPQLEYHLVNLITKIMIASLVLNEQGGLKAIEIPPGFKPKDLNFTTVWPEIFPLTLDDLSKKIGLVTQATSANIVSRETGLKFIAKDFGIENIEEEVAKVNAQPIFNPFGAF